MKVFSALKTALLLVSIIHPAVVTAAASIQPAINPVTLPLTSIPIDDPELVNPGRGYFKWRGEEIVPAPESAYDEYERYFWHDPENPDQSLETSPGVYNFSMVDQAISAAASRGHKFAFRFRAMGDLASKARYIPDYLSECGWNHRRAFIPDWNGACFLDNAEKLMQALGARYNRDPRIAWMDIGLYGEWGEWALSEEIYRAAPAGISIATDKSLARIIDIQVDAFPQVRKVMFAKTRSEAVIHALSRSEQIGWRVDCFARNGYFDFPTHPRYSPAWKIMQDRWKTAPVIVEFCAGDISLSSNIPLKQIQEFHISQIGNGNIQRWSRFNKNKQEKLILLGKTAGYRYQIQDITVPETWVPSSTIRVTTAWENVGVSPHYEPTVVSFKLYDPKSSTYVWEARSAVNLQTLLPTGDRPFVVQDKLALAAHIAPGVYQLRLIVADPTQYRKPLKLAITRRQSDGSYLLGKILVGPRTGWR